MKENTKEWIVAGIVTGFTWAVIGAYSLAVSKLVKLPDVNLDEKPQIYSTLDEKTQAEAEAIREYVNRIDTRALADELKNAEVPTYSQTNIKSQKKCK